MGNISTCLSDVWSITGNPSGLAQLRHTTFGATYHAIPSFQPFNRGAAVFAMPVASGAGGISAFRFGDDLYNEHVLSAAYANTFGLASLGIKLNYIQYRGKGMESRTALTVSFGGIARLTPELSFGGHITNINQPVINDLTGEKVPTRIAAGISFTPSDRFMVSSEIEKDIRLPPVIRTGLEYQIFSKVSFRTGFNLRPGSAFFGIGFKVRRLQLDYAMQSNQAFGLGHQATMVCRLKSQRQQS